MRASRFAYTFVACLLLVAILATPGSRAAEAPAAPDALQQKTEEVERLKRELDLREKELRQLEQENERLRKEQGKQERQRQKQQEQSQQDEIEQLRKENQRLRQEPGPDPAVAPTARELKPVTPIPTLPPLAPDAVVDADELVGHFLAEPANAARRYAGKTFGVKGEVDRFDRAMVAREFSVMLVSPDRATAVKFKFNYVDQYHSVFTAKDGRELVARYAPGSDGPLLKVAEPVVLRGHCHGLKDGAITFTKSVIER